MYCHSFLLKHKRRTIILYNLWYLVTIINILNELFQQNRIGGEMFKVLASSAVDRGFGSKQIL
jgi:hypothetical protein